ncbi:hypothetical protein H072_4750 [Dactylellina haptotyla CBS 200.50]|uniref:ABC transporter domain-containing protein n=1 Tax=Dactylellina haptotyla (strain CBS 200.50) TaxID=1284197 RepID=S8AJS0_DACHA|nr:hypothetical protein H072_4750 [Dactylellina haptotyla CBS 200.50]
MVRLISAGSLLLAVGLFTFMATSLIRNILAKDELAISAAVQSIHYAYPIITFAYYVGSSMLTVVTFKSLRKAKHPKTQNRKKLVLGLAGGVILTYILQGVHILFRSFRQTRWGLTTHENVYVLSSILIWTVLQVSILDSTYVIWYPYSGCWYISIGFELLILFLTDLRRSHTPRPIGLAWILVIGLRIVLLILLPLLFHTLPQTNNKPISDEFDEERGLLSKQRESGVDDEADDNLGIYGSFFDTESDDERTKKTKAKLQAKWEESGNWWNYAKSFSIFWPMIWPSNNRKLKTYTFFIGVTLAGQSVLNVLVPRQFGLVTDSFLKRSEESDEGSSPWVQVSLFIIFKLLQSNAGLFAIKDYLWVPVQQYSYRMITTSAYNHILSLSYDFHCDKRSGELFMSISNARSINLFIDMMLFSFLPMLADLMIAFVYLYFLFGPYMALLVAFVTVSFLWSTSKMANYSQCTRRDFLKASRKEGDTMWETVSNWQNISYFNNLQHEQNRYMDAILDYQRFERKHNWGTSFLKVLQALIFTLGLLGACYLAVYTIVNGKQPVGSFVTLLLYWTQLSAPLTFFADFFRRLNTSMIDAERVLEILSLKPTVTNRKNARKLEVKDGEVALDNVYFDYDERKPAIKGISLRAKPGTTVAIVGETGAGKSTILRLLFRFYDVKKGSIKIDGQDIRDVTLETLRDAIGVVPQDPTLFNDTIMNNLRYANFNATDHEIYKACEAAAIHSQILSFPDGYSSIVGERGVKLSGGELQRIAIARAMIKNPKIILLDEATSMVDMHTERRIQKAFSELAKGRTTFVIAHRLSTVVNADQIIVINDGKIKEIGTHEDLLRRGDAYHKLWNKQVRESVPASGPAKRPEPVTGNDLSANTQDQQKTGEIEATLASEGSNATSNNATSICQPPEHRHRGSSINATLPRQINGTNKGAQAASLPHYCFAGPAIGNQPSTLKANAPEYLPLAVDTSRPALPPAYSVGNRSSRMRGKSFHATASSSSLTQASQTITNSPEAKRAHADIAHARDIEHGNPQGAKTHLTVDNRDSTNREGETGNLIDVTDYMTLDDSDVEVSNILRPATTAPTTKKLENTPVGSLASTPEFTILMNPPPLGLQDTSILLSESIDKTKRSRFRHKSRRGIRKSEIAKANSSSASGVHDNMDKPGLPLPEFGFRSLAYQKSQKGGRNSMEAQHLDVETHYPVSEPSSADIHKNESQG